MTPTSQSPFRFGWRNDPRAVAAVLTRLPMPSFETAAPHLKGTGAGNDVFFWDAEIAVLGKQLPPWDQGQLGCHDSATEVLTEKGWVRWPDYNGTDLLGTANPATGYLEYQAPTAVQRCEYDGPLYRVKHESLDFAVTPNHRMFVCQWDEKRGELKPGYAFQRVDAVDEFCGVPRHAIGIFDVDRKQPGYGRGDFVGLRRGQLFQEHYRGEVFCATVPNSTLVTRRNGQVLISGNSCVAHGSGRAAQDLLLIQIAASAAEEWDGEVAREPIYGGSRVQVGGEKGSYEDGSVGAWAADWLRKWGVVIYKSGGDGLDGYYTVERCKQWGAEGVPDNYQTLAKKHPVQTTSQVTTAQAAQDALANGYPISICGQISRTMKRDPGGWCPAVGNDWPHCVPPSSWIAGPTFRRAKDVSVGDSVFGHDGREHEITAVHKRHYRGPMMRVRARGLTPVEVTADHPVLAYRRAFQRVPVAASRGFAASFDGERLEFEKHGRWEPCWVFAKDLRPGDYLVTPVLRQDGGEVELPQWEVCEQGRNVPPPVTAPDDDLAWLFGFYVADGNRRINHGINFTLGKSKPLDRLVPALQKLGVEPKVKEFSNWYRVAVDSVIVERSFVRWFGEGSSTKHFPEWAFHGWNLESFLEGYLAGDGWVTNGGGLRGCHTISEVLAHQVRLILALTGQRPSCCRLTKSSGYSNGKPSYMMTWQVRPRHGDIPRVGGFNAHKVKSVIMTSYNGDVYNYDVADVHSYVADGVVVHNCQELCGVCNTKGNKPAFCYRNSWADYLGSENNQVELESGKVITLPAGCYLSDFESVERDLKQGDSFAYSHAQGFPAQTIPWNTL